MDRDSDTSSHRRPNPRDLGLPYEGWRPEQWHLIEKICNSDKRFHLIQAPPGKGKSGFSMGLLRYLEETGFIVVKTKQLQWQYRKEFRICSLKGGKNYICNYSPSIDPEDPTYLSYEKGLFCSVREEKDKEEDNFDLEDKNEKENFDLEDKNEKENSKNQNKFEKCDFCIYKLAKNNASNSKEFVTNYDYFLTQRFFEPRDWLILDEAHFADMELVDALSFTIRNDLLKRANITIIQPIYDVEDWLEIFDQLISILSEDLKQFDKEQKWLQREISEHQKRKAPIPDEIWKKFNRVKHNYNQTKYAIEKIEFLKLNLNEKDWIINYRERSVEFKPIWSFKYTDDRFFRYAKKIIFMSATILDKELFCELMGIRSDDCEFHDLPMTWDKSIRPIYYKPACNCSSREIEKNKPILLKAIDLEISNRLGLKGVIHTTTDDLANYIQNNSQFKKIMLTHTQHNREEIIKLFKLSPPPKVLISPSAKYGLNLPYDECRYQILAKVPFLPFEDDNPNDLIKKRMQQNEKWYNWTVVCEIIQAYGRGVRAKDDYCEFLILDSTFGWFYRRNKHLFPKWFSEAIKWC